MYMCNFMWAQMYVGVYIHTHTHMYMCNFMWAQMYVGVYIYTHTHIYMCDFTWAQMYVGGVYIHTHIYMCNFTWASMVSQLVKNPPSMPETLARFPGREDPLEKGKATQSSIHRLPWWLRW